MGDTYDYGEPDENEAERLTRNLMGPWIGDDSLPSD